MKRLVAALVLAAAPARAELPPAHDDEWERIGSVVTTSDADADAIAERLRGHEIRKTPGRLWITRVANEGSPWVGVVERRGRALWLVGEQGSLELRGPLARPRLAGPGYTIWVLGDLDPTQTRITVRRLGVLRAPER